MIIYGTRATHLHTERLVHEKCPNCETKGDIYSGIFGHYFHLFFIPFFPLRKKAVCQCQTCKHAMKEREMPLSFRRSIDAIKLRIAFPKWHYSGLALVIVVVIWFSFNAKHDKKLEGFYLKHPQAGDIYRYKLANNYSTLKVIEVTSDSIVVYPNQYESTQMAGIYQIDKPENYMKLPMSYSKDELVSMYKEGTIYSIDR